MSLIFYTLQPAQASIDEQSMIAMIAHIKHQKLIGPNTDDHPIAERVEYALDKGLITHLRDGNFKITAKGEDLLNGSLPWTAL